MAADNGTGYNKTEMRKYLNNINSDITSFKNNLLKLKADVLAIEKGDGKQAYWSGKSAKTNIKNLKTHYNNCVSIYNAFVKVYNKYYADMQKIESWF